MGKHENINERKGTLMNWNHSSGAALIRSLAALAVVLFTVPRSDASLAESPVTPEVKAVWDYEFTDLENRIDKFGHRHEATPFPITDENVEILAGDLKPSDVVIRRVRALIDFYATVSTSPANLSELKSALTELEGKVESSGKSMELFHEACELRRRALLVNPLIDFDEVVYVRRFAKLDHVGRTQGHWAQPCGGIHILSGLKTGNLQTRNLLQNSRFENGPREGKSIVELQGAYGWIDLSFDANKLVFSWTEKADKRKNYSEEASYHVYSVNMDGTNLRQLTTGIHDDGDPIWLPNGRILFMSGRHERASRCGGGPNGQPDAAHMMIHSMKADGSDLFPISWNETNERMPSVDNNGMVVYTRWDYVDRDYNAAHNLWMCGPDGTDPRAPHGNYPLSFWSKDRVRDGRNLRPWSEHFIRAVPNTTTKYVAVAGGHHAPASGTPVIIDLSIPDDGKSSQVQWYLSGHCQQSKDKCPFPPDCRYMSPNALSEDFLLVCRVLDEKGSECGPSTGIGIQDGLYIMDRFGNKDLIHPCPSVPGEKVLPTYMQAIPVKPRPGIPAVTTRTFQGERHGMDGHYRATLGVLDVYEADFEWPEGTEIKELRIIQVFGRTWKHAKTNQPRISWSNDANARMCLGTVPVEDDGSAYFEAPVGKLLYFQALDERGLAIQSMRSGAYVHPGEQLTCTGCHEDRWQATPISGTKKAFTRPPSKIEVEREEARPGAFGRLVKPVFDNTCLPCHLEKNKGLQSFDYDDLELWGWALDGSGGGGGSRCDSVTALRTGCATYKSPAGRVGALASKMGQQLLATHKERVSSEELHRVTLWLDLNSPRLSYYYNDPDTLYRMEHTEDIIWPLDVDPLNPTAAEMDRPVNSSGDSTVLRRGTGKGGFAIPDFRITVAANRAILHMGRSKGAEAQLIDAAGKCLVRQSLESGHAVLSLKSLSSGVYFVRVTGQADRWVRPLTITR